MKQLTASWVAVVIAVLVLRFTLDALRPRSVLGAVRAELGHMLMNGFFCAWGWACQCSSPERWRDMRGSVH